MSRVNMRVSVVIAGVLLALATGGLQAQGVRDEALRKMTPQQREQLWRSMTPQQRTEFWRRLTPEQRHSIRTQNSPQPHEAMRGRMMDERRDRGLPEPPDSATPLLGRPQEPRGPRRWSMEERRRFREQILESTRDMRDAPGPRMRMEQGKNRER